MKNLDTIKMQNIAHPYKTTITYFEDANKI